MRRPHRAATRRPPATDADALRRPGRPPRSPRRGCARRPGLARPRPAAAPAAAPAPSTPRPPRPTPADRAAVVRAFVAAAGGLETAGYCRPTAGPASFANSAGQQVAGETAECRGGRRHRPRLDGRRRRRPPMLGSGLADLDGAALGAGAAAKARAAARTRSSSRRAATRSSSSPTRVADLLACLARRRLQRQGVNERPSFVRLGERPVRPGGHAGRRPARPRGLRCPSTPRAPRAPARPGRGRRRRWRLTHDRRTAAEAGAASTGHQRRADGSDRRRAPSLLPAATPLGGRRGRGADRRLLVAGWSPTSSGAAGHRLLVHPGARPAHARRHRADPQRGVADRGRPGGAPGAQPPVHPVLRPGAGARQRARRRPHASPVPGDTYTATSPRWSCPALRLASWNFTGGASG